MSNHLTAGRFAVVIVTAGCVSIVAGGCGQRGALYLPEASSEVVTRPTQTPSSAPSQPTQTTPNSRDAASDDAPDKQKPKTPPPSP